MRQEIRAKRRAISPREAKSLGSNISRRFLSLARGVQWADRSIALFKTLPEELPMAVLEKELFDSGARLCFPRMVGDQLEMLQIHDPSSPVWVVGPFGVAEPGPSATKVDPENLDVVFVPGLAFGPSGERLGMGRGFYDRFLSHAPQALRVALCYDFQLLPSLEQQPWDQLVDWIVTEDREVRTSRVESWLAGRGRGVA